jgi:hypothetical protein
MVWRRLRALHACRTGVFAGLLEIALIAGLYVTYTASRLLASNDLGPALHRARELHRFESYVGLDWEGAFNRFFTHHDVVGLFGAYWYSTAHYIVTLSVLVWLYLRHRAEYVTMRRALVVATLLALGMYLLLPTAPPRFLDSFVDVLDLHSAQGWWGADASAPRGLGHLTNELAAFPSLHAGWALWVALAVAEATRNRAVRALGWSHAAVTAAVIVGTGNHWMLDVIVGWLVVLAGCVAVAPFTPMVEARPPVPQPRRTYAPAPLSPVLPAPDGALPRSAEPGASR